MSQYLKSGTVTEDLLKKGMSSKGGWKKAQFALIGIDWPPATGWKAKVLGKSIEPQDEMKFLSLRD